MALSHVLQNVNNSSIYICTDELSFSYLADTGKCPVLMLSCYVYHVMCLWDSGLSETNLPTSSLLLVNKFFCSTVATVSLGLFLYFQACF